MSKKPTKKILKVNLKIIFEKLVVNITRKRTKMFQKIPTDFSSAGQQQKNRQIKKKFIEK